MKAGIFETIFTAFNNDVDKEYVVIDVSSIAAQVVKVHRHARAQKADL